MINVRNDDTFYYIETSTNCYKLIVNTNHVEDDIDLDTHYFHVLKSFMDEVRPITNGHEPRYDQKKEVDNIPLLKEIFEEYLKNGFKKVGRWFKSTSGIYDESQIRIFNTGSLF